MTHLGALEHKEILDVWDDFRIIGISGGEVGAAARAFVYGFAVGGVIGIIIKWTKNIVEKIRTNNNKNSSPVDKNKP